MEAIEYLIGALHHTTPISLAFATHWFFRWLDKTASSDARRALSVWLASRSYRGIDVGHFILDAFDRLYKPPILSGKCFARSATVSISIFVLLGSIRILQHVVALGLEGFLEHFWWRMFLSINFAALAPIVLSDYLSLFVIRKTLVSSKERVSSALLGAIAGIIVVSLCCILLAPLLFLGLMIGFGLDYAVVMFNEPVLYTLLFFVILMIPAFLVHLWLIILWTSMLFMKICNILLDLTGQAQWFIRRGDKHPLRAIGFVSAGGVFAVTAVGKVFLGFP